MNYLLRFKTKSVTLEGKTQLVGQLDVLVVSFSE